MLLRRLFCLVPWQPSAMPKIAPQMILPNAFASKSPCFFVLKRAAQGDREMEVKSFQIDKFIAKPPAGITAALVFGPDQGLVRERANVLARSIVPDLTDPFRVSELDEGRIISDPACLWDEAASLSMFGGQRVVRIGDAGNAVAQLTGRFFALPGRA